MKNRKPPKVRGKRKPLECRRLARFLLDICSEMDVNSSDILRNCVTPVTNSNTVYPLSAVRALALHAQGLAARSDSKQLSTLDEVYSIIEQIGCLQIDTLQMVRRSQNIVLWSRLGSYDPTDLDRLLSDGTERRLFEYWLHAACIIPLSEYRYRLPLMLRYQDGTQGWRRDWAKEPENARLV